MKKCLEKGLRLPQTWSGELISVVTITERNKQKRAGPFLALPLPARDITKLWNDANRIRPLNRDSVRQLPREGSGTVSTGDPVVTVLKLHYEVGVFITIDVLDMG